MQLPPRWWKGEEWFSARLTSRSALPDAESLAETAGRSFPTSFSCLRCCLCPFFPLMSPLQRGSLLEARNRSNICLLARFAAWGSTLQKPHSPLPHNRGTQRTFAFSRFSKPPKLPQGKSFETSSTIFWVPLMWLPTGRSTVARRSRLKKGYGVRSTEHKDTATNFAI